MKYFKINIPKINVEKIISDSFPKLSTLLFNAITRIDIFISKVIQKISSFSYGIIKFNIIIIPSLIKLYGMLKNNVLPIKIKLNFLTKSIEKTQTNILNSLKINYLFKSLSKILFLTSINLFLSASPLVGKFRTLGDLDPYYFSEIDNSLLSELDFIVG